MGFDGLLRTCLIAANNGFQNCTVLIEDGRDVMRYAAEQPGVMKMRMKAAHRLRQDLVAAGIEDGFVKCLVGTNGGDIVMGLPAW